MKKIIGLSLALLFTVPAYAYFPSKASGRDQANDTFADDQVWVADSSSAGTPRAIPDCTDATGNHLNYTASTNSFSCGTSSAGSGDVTDAGNCATGACFTGTSGNILTFDTNGGTYGLDGTITLDQTNNWFKFQASGLTDTGSAYEPVVTFYDLQNQATSHTGAMGLFVASSGVQAGLGASWGGYTIYSGWDGTSNGGGFAMYQNTIYPTDINGTSTTYKENLNSATPTNNVINLGDSSYRYASVYSVLLNLSGILTTTADVKLTTAGNGIYIKEGSNATMGTATLSAGAATVSTTKVTANSRIFLTTQSLGTVSVPKEVAVTARSAGTSFTITSADNTDTSVVAWMIVEPS